MLPFKAVTAQQQLPDFQSTHNKCAWIIEVNEDSSPERKALIASAIERNYVPAGYIAGVCFNVKNPEAMTGSPDEITLFDALPDGIREDPLLDFTGNGSSPLQLLSVRADFWDDVGTVRRFTEALQTKQLAYAHSLRWVVAHANYLCHFLLPWWELSILDLEAVRLDIDDDSSAGSAFSDASADSISSLDDSDQDGVDGDGVDAEGGNENVGAGASDDEEESEGSLFSESAEDSSEATEDTEVSEDSADPADAQAGHTVRLSDNGNVDELAEALEIKLVLTECILSCLANGVTNLKLRCLHIASNEGVLNMFELLNCFLQHKVFLSVEFARLAYTDDAEEKHEDAPPRGCLFASGGCPYHDADGAKVEERCWRTCPNGAGGVNSFVNTCRDVVAPMLATKTKDAFVLHFDVFAGEDEPAVSCEFVPQDDSGGDAASGGGVVGGGGVGVAGGAGEGEESE